MRFGAVAFSRGSSFDGCAKRLRASMPLFGGWMFFVSANAIFEMSVLEREQRIMEKPNRSNGRRGVESNGDNAQKYFKSVENILEYILTSQAPEKAGAIVDNLINRLRVAGLDVPPVISSPYVNTIPAEEQQKYPGDLDLERKIKSYVRWNAMAMVVNANRRNPTLGGHISSFASSATLYEVAQNHFFRGGDNGRI